MKRPDDALSAARRAAGGRTGGDLDPVPWSLDHSSISRRQLAEWAMIEPEEAEVYSTRRFGRPITALKRVLIHLLRQYIGQMSAQQSRFNAHVAAHVMRVEDRLQELEDAARARDAAEDAGQARPAEGAARTGDAADRDQRSR